MARTLPSSNTPASSDALTCVSHPGIVAALLDSLGGQNTLGHDERQMLLLDPALSLHVLSIIASQQPHALLTEIDLTEALDHLNTSALKQVILASAIRQIVNPASRKATEAEDTSALWLQAIATAALSRALAEAQDYHHPEEAWLAGLFSHLPVFVQGSAQPLNDPKHAQQMCLERLERLPIRSFLPDVVRYLHEPASRLLDAAPLVRLALASHRLVVQSQAKTPSTNKMLADDGVFLAQSLSSRPISTETLSRMLQTAHQTAAHLTETIPTPSDMSAEVVRFGRLEGAANHAGADIEQAITSLANSLAAEDGLYDPIYLALNKRTSMLVAHPLNDKEPPPITLRVEGSNTAAVRALFTRSSVVVYAKSSDTAVLDQQLIRQAKADGLAALPVGEGDYRGVLLICGDKDALQKLEAEPRHYARLGELAGRTPPPPSVIVESGAGGALDALPGRVRRAAHEVNNPLGIIKNYLAILKVKLGDDAPIADELRIIHEELDRIVRIVRGMLHEDVEMGELDEDTDINLLLDDMVKVTAPTWHAKGVQIKTELSTGLPRLQQDRDKLKQIVLNLLLNALEATPEGGKVRLETAAVTNQRRERFLEILVADSGPGIAPDRADVLFDVVESDKGEHHAGLGLSIVKTLTESLDGFITFKSTASGTTFQISLPLGENPKGRGGN